MQEVSLQIWESKLRRCQTTNQTRSVILKLTAAVLKEAGKVAWSHKIPQTSTADYRHNMACQEISVELEKQEKKYLTDAEKLK